MTRDALRDDEVQVLELLQSVLRSESCKTEVLSLENENAERFLVLLQDVIDSFPIDNDLRHAVHRLSIKLSQASEKLPTSLLLRSIVTSSDRHVGGGGFADIFTGEYAQQDVALKRFRIFQSPRDKVRIRKMFFREALIWHRLRHPRVLPFLGIDAESFVPHICIVSPWISNGDIMKYLARNGLGSLNAHRVLTEVSEGLQYLHKQNVVHGDLRGGNIFLDDSCHVLLADFGLSNFVDATRIATTVHRDGSTRWMSPELLAPKKFGMSFRRTFASDVYAFGCVCLEVLTGEHPFSDIPSDGDFLMAVLTSQSTVQPTRPDLGECLRQMVLDKLWPLILRCLEQDPRDRPSSLCDFGSLPKLVTAAGVVTTEPEVNVPTATHGSQFSLSNVPAPSEQLTDTNKRSGATITDPGDFSVARTPPPPSLAEFHTPERQRIEPRPSMLCSDPSPEVVAAAGVVTIEGSGVNIPTAAHGSQFSPSNIPAPSVGLISTPKRSGPADVSVPRAPSRRSPAEFHTSAGRRIEPRPSTLWDFDSPPEIAAAAGVVTIEESEVNTPTATGGSKFSPSNIPAPSVRLTGAFKRSRAIIIDPADFSVARTPSPPSNRRLYGILSEPIYSDSKRRRLIDHQWFCDFCTASFERKASFDEHVKKHELGVGTSSP
ncbi:hypothetical protein JAAARDRAFT_39580 [Jaapia argillacea MUCL 33604]|uniref:C2H2-type domain-containing protein n=1 Tax=Jaapia argillacea MUCL 33604 TaxID=933084 RepID=A0A067PEJ2_9AGAM|nr:hypothetical protein JAAARDRAFT_39580 [Jaapia argillacea MUCL 33604]